MLSLCSCIIYRNFHFVKRKITKNYKNNYKQVTPPAFSCFRRATFPDFRLFSNSFDAIFSQNCHFGYKRIVTVRVTNGFPLGVYVPPKLPLGGIRTSKASPWGSWQGAALTDEGRYKLAGQENPGEFVYRKSRSPLPSPAGEGARRRMWRGPLAGLPC